MAEENCERLWKIWEDFYKRQRERERFSNGKFHPSQSMREKAKGTLLEEIEVYGTTKSVVEIAMDICLKEEFVSFSMAMALDPIVRKQLLQDEGFAS